MKYAMVVLTDAETYQPLSSEQRDFEQIAGWWASLEGKVVARARLGPPDRVTSVSWRDGQPIVTDGPYVEAKETVGGIVVIEVESVQQAVELASTFPNKLGTRIEVRPVLER